MAKIKFYLERRKDKTSDLPIILKYSFLNQRLEYYTGYRVDKNHYNEFYWKDPNQNKKPVKKSAPRSEFINENLLILVSHIQNIQTNAKALGIPISPDYIKEELNKLVKSKPEESKRVTFMQYFDMYIEHCKTGVNQKTGHLLSKSAAIKYTTIKNLFKDFEDHRGKDVDFDDFDKDLYNEFVNYMITEKKYAINTYGRAVKFVKTVLNSATEQGYNSKQDFKSAFKGVSEPSDSTYLTETELEAINKLDLSGNFKLDRVRDLFLVGCWTGLRFSDFTTIRKEDINGDRIRIKTLKTKHKVVIPIHPTVKQILEKYNYELPPAISNQKFNDYLGEVAKKAELNELFTKHITKGGKAISVTKSKYEFVTSHVARRSFATNAYKRNIEPLLIMAITGHKTETEFLKYIKVTDEEKADLFAERANW